MAEIHIPRAPTGEELKAAAYPAALSSALAGSGMVRSSSSFGAERTTCPDPRLIELSSCRTERSGVANKLYPPTPAVGRRTSSSNVPDKVANRIP
jgi:hypothetical protein